MEVELVRWPAEENRLVELRRSGRARLLLVDERSAPPMTVDVLEDWVRLPVGDDDLRHRMVVLDERVRSIEPATPDLDEDGLLRFDGSWVSLAPIEQRLASVLVERFGSVVRRDVLVRAGWPCEVPDRNVLDVHVLRLRRRLEPVGLVLRTVRSRGYLLEPAS